MGEIVSAKKSQSRKLIKRATAGLDPKLDGRLLAYAAAASAAGVGMLALAQPSQAEVVYTPTHQVIRSRAMLALDLNSDGITDFTLSNVFSSCSIADFRRGVAPECSPVEFQDLEVLPQGANLVLENGSSFASALPPGKKVGPGDKFGAAYKMEGCSTFGGFLGVTSGPWRNVSDRYLGLEFSIQGQIHYGWARLNVSRKPDSCTTFPVLTGYAYETVPNKPIGTGKTSGTDEVSGSERPEAGTLGSLAQGGVLGNRKP